MRFLCSRCGLAVTNDVLPLDDVDKLCETDGKDFVPSGRYAISDGGYYTGTEGKVVVNVRDLTNVQNHPDPCRLNGCCGLDGSDGVNKVCANGHEIATEKSDCWIAHAAILEPGMVREEKSLVFRSVKETAEQCFAKSAERKQKTIDGFKDRYGFQSDDQFFKECGLKNEGRGSSIALAVRKTLARIGRVGRGVIRAEMTFEELEVLPGIRQCLEFHLDRFIDSLESELGQKLSQHQAERIGLPQGRVTVCDFVHDIIEALRVTS
jgi:hypothetical protein